MDRATLNNLVTLYSKSKVLSHYSVRVFNQIPSPNVVSWTALISAHSNTLLSLLRRFLSMLHHPSLFRTSAALALYFQSRFPHHERKMFDEIPHRGSVCYPAMIVGPVQNSLPVDALLVFADMRHRGFASTEHSVLGGLHAAAELAALEWCGMIHAHAVVAGFDSNVVVVDGYGNAGVVGDARRVCKGNLPWMNVVGWNAMLAGYAQQGDHKSTKVCLSLLHSHSRSQHSSSGEPPHHHPKAGLHFCIWVALKFETIYSKKFRNLVSRILSSNNWFSLYWDALQILKKSGILITSESVRALIRTYSKMGLTEEAIESFGRMSELDCKPDAHNYNTILRVVVRKELFVLAFAVYNTMLKSNCSPNEYTYNLLVDAFCKSGNINGALQMIDEMDLRGLLPNVITFTAIISGLCQGKKVDEACRLFNTMKERGCLPDLVCYNALLSGFCKLGRIDEALSFFRLLERDGYTLGQKGYSSLINGLFRARRYNEAHAWYSKMFKEGIVPDVILYTIMIRGLSEEGRVGEAAKMLDEMTWRGLVPDACCYNAVIKGFCDIGLLDQAKSLQLEVSKHEQFHNSCTYTILICGMSKKGMVGEAQEIFNQMEKLGCLPSVVTFNALINGLCKAGKLDEAHLLLYKMEIGRSPSLFFRLSQGSDRVFDSVSLQKKVEQMCEDGQILNAYKLLVQLAGSGVVPDIMTYNILINGFCKTGNINGAFKLFKDLQLKGLVPDSVTYGTLIDGLYRVDREEDALKIREHMLKHGCEASFSNYKTLMTWLSRKGKISQTFSLYLEYLKSIRGLEDDSINALEEYFVKGNVEEAIRGLLKMDFKFRDFNLAPYTILLIGFCQAKKVHEALVIFSVLSEFNININPASCVHLINGLCSEGKLDEAANIFLYALDKGFMLTPRICNHLLKCLLLSVDKKDYAIDLIGRMKFHGYRLNMSLSQNIVPSTKKLQRGPSDQNWLIEEIK